MHEEYGTEYAIEMVDAWKVYKTPGGTVEALRGINLALELGMIHVLLGPNGSGKTTSLETTVGLRSLTRGTVRTLGVNPKKADREIHSRVAIQPQEVKVFEYLRVGEILRLWASFYPESRASTGNILESLELDHLIKRRVTKLSGGQRQRLNVALAMVSQPELLILDEPSTGLDPRARQQLWSVLKEWGEEGTTIVLSTHSMEEAHALAQSVAIIDKGECVQSGSPEQLIKHFCGGPYVSFELISPLDTEEERILREFGKITVDSKGATAVSSAQTDDVLAFLSRTGKAKGIQVQHPTLGDAYFAATGTNIVDSVNISEGA